MIAWLFDYQFSKVTIFLLKLKIARRLLISTAVIIRSHLIYSGDKQFFTNENKTAFLMYRYKASSLVVLGDPLGDENAFDELLEAF